VEEAVTSNTFSPFTPDEKAIRCMAAEALDRVLRSSTPRVLFWDAESKRLRTISADAGSAKSLIAHPSCLGTYDFDARLQDIIDDLKTVYATLAN
jgi:hypothetical protein